MIRCISTSTRNDYENKKAIRKAHTSEIISNITEFIRFFKFMLEQHRKIGKPKSVPVHSLFPFRYIYRNHIRIFLAIYWIDLCTCHQPIAMHPMIIFISSSSSLFIILLVAKILSVLVLAPIDSEHTQTFKSIYHHHPINRVRCFLVLWHEIFFEYISFIVYNKR